MRHEPMIVDSVLPNKVRVYVRGKSEEALVFYCIISEM